MRSRYLFAPAVLLASALPTHADVTYDLTLTAYNPSGLGSGTLTLNTLPPANGYEYYVTAAYASGYNGPFPYRIEGLTINFDGYTFNLDPQTSAADAFFVNGVFQELDAALSIGETAILFGNDSFGGIGFPTTFEFFTGAGDMYAGGVTAVLAPPTPTPEPSTLALLGTGLLTAVGAVRRKLA